VASCAGAPLTTTARTFESLGRTALLRTCSSGDGVPTFSVVDQSTGAPVDLDALERDDAVVFHNSMSSLRAGVRAALDVDPLRKWDVYIWFRTDMTDELPKEYTSASLLAATEHGTREARTLAKATALGSRLAKIPGLEVISKASGHDEYGAPVVVARGNKAALELAGALDEVWEIVPIEATITPATTDYFSTTLDSWLDAFGVDGTGGTVAALEFVRPDSSLNLDGWPTGSCSPDSGFGTARKCHCAAGSRGAHVRQVMGVVRSSALAFGGMADEVSTIAANYDGGCVTNGPDAFSSALNWATANGARVINCSDQFGPDPLVDSFQSSRDRLFDYKASVYPWPFVSVIAGNGGVGSPVMSRPRNGMSVGAATETAGTDRNQVIISSFSSSANPNGAGGFEVPHLVAIGQNVDTAGKALGTVDTNLAGTSVAAPQVAGIVAALHEHNPTLKSWPEVVIPGLMAAADEDVDGTPFSLSDGIDDADGAGLINAAISAAVLGSSAKRNGGGSAEISGHDYGNIYESTTPTYTTYSETYNAWVDNGMVLRVAVFMQSRPTCPATPGCTSPNGFAGCTSSSACSANPFVLFSLAVYDGNQIVAASTNSSTNYQFVRVPNTSGSAKSYNIRIIPLSYSGLPGTTWGIAWTQAGE
jgi:hypothetical protein